LPRFPFH